MDNGVYGSHEGVQMWYALAKTLAEKEAWKFAKEHNLDLVVVNPSYVIGRFPTPVPSSTVLYILYLVQGICTEHAYAYFSFYAADSLSGFSFYTVHMVATFLRSM